MKIKIKKFTKWGIVLILIVAIGGFVFYKTQNKGDNKEYVTSKVVRGDLSQTVSATGVVKPLTELDLSFSASGKIIEILVEKGQEVKKDDILARQDDSSLLISEKQAQANLLSAVATLDKLKAGASKEDIEVVMQNVASAQVTYNNAVKNLETLRTKTTEEIKKYEDGVTSAQNTLADKKINLTDTKNKYSQNIKNIEQSAGTTMSSHLFTVDSALDLVNKALTNNDAFDRKGSSGNISQLKSNYLNYAYTNYDKAVEMLEIMKTNASAVKSGTASNVGEAIVQAINTLDEVKQALNNSFNVLQNTIATTKYSQTNIDTNKTDLNAKQIVVESAIAELQTSQQNLIDAKIDFDNQTNSAQALVNSAEDAYTTAKISLSAAEANRDLQISGAEAEIDSALAKLNLTKSELILKNATPRKVDLASQEAQVQQYQASLALVQDNLLKTKLISSMDGIVVDVLYKLGEQAVANNSAVKLISDHNYAIEVDISESDIAKVKIKDSVSVSFDSLSEDQKFKGEVVFIDPAQTIVSDVVYYTVKIILNNEENQNLASLIKPGMTANVDILTDQRKDVFLVPQRAVQRRNGQKYVRILEISEKDKKQNVVEVDVELGLSGDDGLVEVKNGLNENQNVITFVKESAK
jgi:HlyD family secretion protein